MITNAAHDHALPISMSTNSEPVTRTLSATESRNAPRVVVICQRRARYPSAKSVRAAIVKIVAAMPRLCSTWSDSSTKAMTTGVNAMRT